MSGQEEKINKELNLKGTICPYNFVKAKLALEDMEIGQVLKIIVDFPAAKDDVPRGMEYEGQKVLRVKQLNTTDWEIVIRKEK